MDEEFAGFPKISRLSRECVITEKLDGTNAQVFISEDMNIVRAGSRNRWLSVDDDNFGFARWVEENRVELLKLGPGRHFGEWWGLGIQRGYGLKEKRFSLFNTSRWMDDDGRPDCCHVVPVVYKGMFDTEVAVGIIEGMSDHGSIASPGFMDPEGIIVFHTAASMMFKKTVKKDEERKGEKDGK